MGMRNVTRWHDGQMVLRWTAAGLLNAERSFRRIKAYKQMPDLVDALYRHAHPDTAQGIESVGAAAKNPQRPSPKFTRIGTRSYALDRSDSGVQIGDVCSVIARR